MDNVELIKRVENAINGKTYQQSGLNLNHIKKIFASYGIKINRGPRRVLEVELRKLLPEIREAEDEMGDQLMMIGESYE